MSNLEDKNPVDSLLEIVLRQAIHDGADQLCIEPPKNSYVIYEVVDERRIELMPPPEQLFPELIKRITEYGQVNRMFYINHAGQQYTVMIKFISDSVYGNKNRIELDIKKGRIEPKTIYLG